MSLSCQHLVTLWTQQIHGQTTRLCTFSTIGRTSGQSCTQITLSADAHAKRTMHKALQFHIGNRLMNRPNLRYSQLSRQNNACQTQIAKEPCSLDGSHIRLCRGMQFHRRQIHLQQPQILYNQRIYTRIIQPPGHLLRLLQFPVGQYRIQRHNGLRAILMPILRQPLNILHRIMSSRTCTKCRRTNIHRIRPMIYGLNTYLRRLRRRQQLYLSHCLSLQMSKNTPQR